MSKVFEIAHYACFEPKHYEIFKEHRKPWAWGYGKRRTLWSIVAKHEEGVIPYIEVRGYAVKFLEPEPQKLETTEPA